MKTVSIYPPPTTAPATALTTAVNEALGATLSPMDTVLVKGSNGSRWGEFADILCGASGSDNRAREGEEN